MQNETGLNATICPGCGEDVPAQNGGCPHCGYENHWQPDYHGRLMTVAELLAAPAFPEKGALELNNVSPKFLYRFSAEAGPGILRGQIAALRELLRECAEELDAEALALRECHTDPVTDDIDDGDARGAVDRLDDLVFRVKQAISHEGGDS